MMAVAAMTAVVDAATLSREMQQFREGAVLLVQGVSARERAALTDAAEILASVPADENPDVEINESFGGAISNPTILFTPDFCDRVRKSEFQLVPLDPLEGLRNLGEGISTITRNIAPGASASFVMSGSGDMEMVTVCTAPQGVEVSLLSDGVPVEMTPDADGYGAHSAWNIAGDGADIVVTVKNPTDREQTFVLALQ